MSKNGSLSKDKGKKRHNTDFYIETLILTVVLLAVILVLIKVFAFSADLSGRAGTLPGEIWGRSCTPCSSTAACLPNCARRLLSRSR